VWGGGVGPGACWAGEDEAAGGSGGAAGREDTNRQTIITLVKTAFIERAMILFLLSGANKLLVGSNGKLVQETSGKIESLKLSMGEWITVDKIIVSLGFVKT
jgi:hypothetical protein